MIDITALSNLKNYLNLNNNHLTDKITLTIKETNDILEFTFNDKNNNYTIYLELLSPFINDMPNFKSEKYEIVNVFNNVIKSLKTIKKDNIDELNIDSALTYDLNTLININNANWYIYTENFKTLDISNTKLNTNTNSELILIRLFDNDIKFGDLINKYVLLSYNPYNGSAAITFHLKLI